MTLQPEAPGQSPGMVPIDARLTDAWVRIAMPSERRLKIADAKTAIAPVFVSLMLRNTSKRL